MVFLKDYWRADMHKERAEYTILESEKVGNVASFGKGNDGTYHKPLTQLLATESWAVPTQGISYLSHYRMTLKTVGQSLTGFASSREFISAIADAMEGRKV
jgi:hypothetical protein